MSSPTTHPPDPPKPTPSDPLRDFEVAHRALLDEYGVDATSRFLDLYEPPVRVHVVESPATDEDDVPLVFVHGTTEFAGFFAPLLAELDDVPWVAFDRPGFGQSGPFEYTTTNLRRTVTNALAGVLDDCDVERVDLVGHSMGGYTSLAFAHYHPDRVRRVFLFGAVPAFPGTRPPLPLRLLTVPGLGQVIERRQPSGEEGVLSFSAVFGEREGIQHHPGLIRTIAAHQATPKCATAGRSEFTSLFSVRGWHPSIRLRDSELRSIETPTTMVCGTGDTLGGPRAIRAGVARLPDARLLAVETGHVPFFTYPEWCADLLRSTRATE